jgi:hypothetical protein
VSVLAAALLDSALPLCSAVARVRETGCAARPLSRRDPSINPRAPAGGGARWRCRDATSDMSDAQPLTNIVGKSKQCVDR